MKHSMRINIYMAAATLTLPGCHEGVSGEEDATHDDDHKDGLDDSREETEFECPPPTSENPLLGCPLLSGCEPHVCDPGGRSLDDLYWEIKQFFKSNPICTPGPAELLCKMKAADEGTYWPEDVERNITGASEEAGWFLPEQIEALRCLAYQEPSRDFLVTGFDTPYGVPEGIYPNLELLLGATGVEAAAQFMDMFAGLIGAIFHVTVDHVFEQSVEVTPVGNIVIEFMATSYKGIPHEESPTIQIMLSPVLAQNYETGEQVVCPGRYILDQITTTLDRMPDDLDTDPSHMITPEEAVASALEACGSSCSYPPPDWAENREPVLVIFYGAVAWRVFLSCPSSCPSVPDWMCWYLIDAHTGEVIDGGEECCVDC